jgi:flagellar biosynthesis/type III secretory pathway M-ring protein FliF/YscJ
MNTTRPYNFRATLAVYALVGLVIALVIHAIVLSSPKYNWIYPVTSSSDASTTINPAPGAK